MKKNIRILLMMLLPTLGLAQIDYDKIILPDGIYSDQIEEKLVRLAWKNNPMSHMVQDEMMMAKYDLQAVRSKWTNVFGVQGNLNEFTIKSLAGDGASSTNSLFFPRYNLSLSVPMSTFFELPKAKKVAKAKLTFSEDKVNQAKLEMRAKVFKLYSDYKKNQLILNLRKEALADEDSNFLLLEGKFKKGDATYDEYIRVQRSRNELRIQVVTAESEFAKSKYDIEALIGVKLEEVR